MERPVNIDSAMCVNIKSVVIRVFKSFHDLSTKLWMTPYYVRKSKYKGFWSLIQESIVVLAWFRVQWRG